MATQNQTLWDQFLRPVFELLMDQDGLKREYGSVDWPQVERTYGDPAFDYPAYYQRQNFHGIEGGYLNPSAAASYDAVTQYVLPPNEVWVRQGLIDAIAGNPRRIVDLGCGTGSTTLLLKEAFPEADVTGLDLSPYMLYVCDRKAQAASQTITWQHGLAENTPFPAAQFELVTISLLFHETPSAIAKAILKEAYRLLVPGGQIVILDGNQATLRHTGWLTNIFEEPYINDYAQGNLDAWLGAAGFEQVRSQDWWWVNQISSALKPLTSQVVEVIPPQASVETDLPWDAVPAV
ncbi:MAG: class I SAM-dependent methyltransferase [Cyanobacteria bacterium P01_H01_bin.15]